MKSIYEYDNYRVYLKDLYQHSKAESSKFSFRYFSRIAGFKSPNFLKRVIDGERNLALESIDKFAKALKLNKEESFFFRNLVLFNQAKLTEEKQYYAEQLLKSQMYKKIHPLKESQYNYYAHWYFVPIRELVGLTHFKEDYDWIAHAVVPSISPAEAKKAVDELLRLGLLERDASGKLVQSQAHLATTDQIISASLAQFHREMTKKAGESIDRIPRDKREISAITLGLSEKTFQKVREMTRKFQVEIVEAIAEGAKQTDAQNVYQINFQIFPLTNITGGKS